MLSFLMFIFKQGKETNMTRKQLMERKHELIHVMKQMVEHAELETRDLNETETNAYELMETQVKEINKELDACINKDCIVEEKQLEKKEEERSMEKREFAQGLAHGEVRTMTTETHGNVIPTNIYDEIVDKITEMSNVVADTPVVKANGKLEFLIEKEALKSKILDEIEEVSATPISDFDKISLEDKRIAELVLVSKKMLLNSPIVGMDYITNTVARRVSRKLEEQLFQADGSEKSFNSGLLSGEKFELIVDNTISILDIQNLITSMPSVFLNGAKLYMDRSTFQKVSNLQDGNGHFYLTLDTINDKPAYKILGCPVEITEEANGHIVLANVGQAMKLKLGETMNIQVLTEKYATSGQIGVLCDIHCDAALVDKQAVKVLAA